MRALVWMRLGLVPAVLALGIGPVSAGRLAVPTEQVLMVKIEKNATLLDGGDAILIEARTRCAMGFAVVMSNLYVDQGNIDNDVSGLEVVCDGQWHLSTARVESFEGTFEAGEARVMADVTVDSLEGDVSDTDSPLRIVTVRD